MALLPWLETISLYSCEISDITTPSYLSSITMINIIYIYIYYYYYYIIFDVYIYIKFLNNLLIIFNKIIYSNMIVNCSLFNSPLAFLYFITTIILNLEYKLITFCLLYYIFFNFLNKHRVKPIQWKYINKNNYLISNLLVWLSTHQPNVLIRSMIGSIFTTLPQTIYSFKTK